MTDSTDAPVYGLFLKFDEHGAVESTARGNEAVRAIEQIDGVVIELEREGVDVRGFYDLTGFDELGSVLVWLRSRSVTNLQWAQRQLRRTILFNDLMLVHSRLVTELTVIDEEPSPYLNLLDAEDPGDDYDDFIDDGLEVVDDDYIDNPEGENGEGGEEAEAEQADDELDAHSAPGSALVSLHARIGIGPLRYVVVAEADAAIGLIGELGRPFGDDLDLTLYENGEVGRLVSTAELYEVLR